MKTVRKLALGSLVALAPLGWGAGLEAQVTLTPAGSFVAKSASLKGRAAREGDGFQAKNVELDLDSLKTGVELRDKHLKEKYLETKAHPKATLLKAHGKGGKFGGSLKFHGVTKPIGGSYEVSGDELVAKFTLRPADFGVAKASYMGVGVEDEVEVTATIPLGGK